MRCVLMLSTLLATAAASAASTPLGSDWPAEPVADADRTLLERLGAQPLTASFAAEMKQARMLKASNAPPSTEEIAQFNIILFSSIALVIICYFSMMAMVNMDIGSDSLLYSKSKSD